jgi:hypothetical protein
MLVFGSRVDEPINGSRSYGELVRRIQGRTKSERDDCAVAAACKSPCAVAIASLHWFGTQAHALTPYHHSECLRILARYCEPWC